MSKEITSYLVVKLTKIHFIFGIYKK